MPKYLLCGDDEPGFPRGSHACYPKSTLYSLCKECWRNKTTVQCVDKDFRQGEESRRVQSELERLKLDYSNGGSDQVTKRKILSDKESTDCEHMNKELCEVIGEYLRCWDDEMMTLLYVRLKAKRIRK